MDLIRKRDVFIAESGAWCFGILFAFARWVNPLLWLLEVPYSICYIWFLRKKIRCPNCGKHTNIWTLRKAMYEPHYCNYCGERIKIV